MKKKLLSLALFLLTVMSVQPTFAQTWVGDELAAGDFYLYNVGAKKFLYGANAWDTRGSLTEGRNALKCTLETAEEGKYAVSTASVYGGKYLGSNGFVDSGMFAFTITEVGEGTKIYTIDAGGGNFFGYDGTTDVIQLGLADATSENAQWLLISPESYMKIMTEWMEDASETNPKDVSCFLFNPDFKRNVAMWPTFAKADGGVKEKKDAANICTSFVELYAGWGGYTPLKLEQTVTGLPNGKYKVTCKGFFRNGETGTNPNLVSDWVNKTEPVVGMIYANDATSPLKSIFEGLTSDLEGLLITNGADVLGNVPNNVDQTHNWFATNVYDGNEVTALVTDGTLTLGVKTESDVSIHRRWICVDEFSLIYLGVDLTALKENLAEVKTKAEELNTENVNEATKDVLANAIAAAGSVEETAEALEKAIADLNQAILLVENMGVALQDANTVVATHEAFETNSVAEESVKDTYKTAINNAKTTLDEAADLATVESAINSLEEARKVYVYAALPKEGETLDVTFLMKNPNGDNDEGWTFEGPHGNANNQHWSGVTNRYLELCDWGKTGWEAKMSQNVELPRGRYIVSAYGRSEGSAKLELVAGDKVVAFPALGDKGGTIATDGTEWESIEAGVAAGKSFTNDGNGRGWTLAKAEAEVEESLTIGAQASTTAVHQWTSIDDFKLELVGALPDYSDVPTVTFDASAMANGELAFVVASEKPYARVNGKYTKVFGVRVLTSFAEEAPYIRNKETQEVLGGTLDKTQIKGEDNEVKFVFDISEVELPYGTYELVIPRGAYCCPETEEDYTGYVCSGPRNVETVYEFAIEPPTATVTEIASKVCKVRDNKWSGTMDIEIKTDDSFCALYGFDLAAIKEKINSGYAVKEVKLTTTTKYLKSRMTLGIKPMPYSLEGLTRDEFNSNYKDEVKGLETLATVSCNYTYGQEPGTLHKNSALVTTNAQERYDIGAYQQAMQDEKLTQYVKDVLAGDDAEIAFWLYGVEGSDNAYLFTHDVSTTTWTKSTDKYVWNSESGVWEKGEGQVLEFEQACAYFGMTAEEFAAAVTPTLEVVLEEVPVVLEEVTVTPPVEGYSPMMMFTVSSDNPYIWVNGVMGEEGFVSEAPLPYIVRKGTDEVQPFTCMPYDSGNGPTEYVFAFIANDYMTPLGVGTYELVIPEGILCFPVSKDDYDNEVLSGPRNAEAKFEIVIEPSATVQGYESVPGYEEVVNSITEVSVMFSAEVTLNTEADAPVAYLQLAGSEEKIAYTSAAVSAEDAKVITFTFDEITAEGDYSIVVPEKAVVTAGGDWNTEYMSTFTVKAPAVTEIFTVISSKDIQLRGDTDANKIKGQNPTGATLEIRETSNDAAYDYAFCGLMGFDLSSIRTKMAEGFKVKDVQIVLTQGNQCKDVLSIQPFGDDWEEAAKPTWADMETRIMESASQAALAQAFLPDLGKKPFELRDKQAVEHYDIAGYQGTFDDDALTAYVANALAGSDAGVSFLVVNTNTGRTGNAPSFFTKDANAAGYGASETNKWAWNAESGAWQEVAGESQTRYQQMLDYFGMTEAEFQEAVAPKLVITLEEAEFVPGETVTAVVTPEAGTEFETITAENKFTVEFSADVTLAENAQIYFKPMMGRQRFAATMVVEGNKGTITPSVEIKEAGRYSLVIEAKAVTDAEGNWNAYTEVAYNVTGAPLAETYKPISITPAEGAVTSLKNFVLKFEAGTYAFPYVEFTEVVYLENKDTQEKVNATLDMGEEPYDNVIITLAEAVTAAGTYTLVIPAKAVLQTEDDWGNGEIAVTPALTYEFTIVATGIDAIFADGAIADVYTVGGVLVKKGATREDVKALKKGLYIINGQTVLLK